MHEITRVELTYRLMFFLYDLGIKSARAPAIITWQRYMYIQTSIAEG